MMVMLFRLLLCIVFNVAAAAAPVPIVILGRLTCSDLPLNLIKVLLGTDGGMRVVCDPGMHSNVDFYAFLCRETGILQEGSRSIFPARFCRRLPRCNAGLFLFLFVLSTVIFPSCGKILFLYTLILSFYSLGMFDLV